MTSHDVIVIGLGVGGEAVAGSLAQSGLDVIGIERNLVGGECPYWGCIPSKMMLRAAGSLAEVSRVRRLAGDAHSHPDYTPVAQRIRDEATDDWNDKVAVERLEGKGGTFRRGQARIVGPGEVEVEGDRYTARRGIVIAAGGSPSVPPIDGLAEVDYWTNRDATEAKEAPNSLIVLGGGPIGLEIGQAFSRFGTSVTIVEMASHVIPAEEPENASALQEVLRADGIDVRTGVSASRVARSSDKIVVELSDGTTLGSERLLVATGRRLNLPDLGLERVGLDPDARSIDVDENLRAAEGVWAVGDITGKGAFTHIATYQARLAVADILGRDHDPADYTAVPRVTFTDPEVASVGLSEAQARDRGIDVSVGVAKTGSSARGWIHGPGAEHGVVKLVADSKRAILVGASAMGPAAGEVVGLLLLAVRQRVPVTRLQELIFPYPTFVRGIEDALNDLVEG
ncbi:MAG TPA: NAD(P)/FAD-dependent oxidoreductase [Actinomycetota bacterium]|nr:NAD(P)/FAD-dependent oxidoreductase [Actinomycetota bacterium]